MYRLVPRAALAGIALVTVAACSSDPVPLPTDPVVRRQGAAAVQRCDHVSVRRAINSLYPGSPARAAAHQMFNSAWQISRWVAPEEKLAIHLTLVADLLAREASGALLDPPGATTTQQGVANLVNLLYICGGRAPLGDVLLTLLTDPQRALKDIALGVGIPDEPFLVRTPSGNFAISDEGDFLDEPALFVLQRIPDGPPFSPGFDEFPPRFDVSVIPYDAQANFDDGGEVETGATAVVSICPRDPHPAPTSLRVLRNPEPFLDGSLELLPVAPAVGTDCAQPPPFAVAAFHRGDQSALARFATAGWDALRQAGSAALRVVSPAPLYAVDGGIGGRVRLMSDFVAVRPVPISVTVDSVVFRNAAGAPITSLSLDIEQSAAVTAVPLGSSGTGGYTPIVPLTGIACTWTSLDDLYEHVTVSPAVAFTTTVTRNSYGSAQVQVSCNGTSAILPVNNSATG